MGQMKMGKLIDLDDSGKMVSHIDMYLDEGWLYAVK